MPNPQSNYTDFDALNTYIQNKVKDAIVITYRNCEEYEGMVLAIMIVFDIRNEKYELDLQWMSLGIDLYGDTLQESYLYRFESFEKILNYLREKYGIQVTDIPVKYEFDHSRFPSPIKDEAKKPLFEAAWQRFQDNFASGVFLDPSLRLVYSTHDC